jgi:hypothetical protein
MLLVLGVAALAASLSTGPSSEPTPTRDDVALTARTVEDAESCAGCHRERQPGILAQWDASHHAAAGVRCEDCHGSDHVAILAVEGRVPASKCGACHEKETKEFLASAHARSARGAQRNARLLAQIPAMQRRGCMACHDIGPQEDEAPGAGRCNACHGAHRHSAADARRPEACGTCHMGPDHPHLEAWQASPHGVTYGATGDESQAPTCVTCHMEAGSHDVSGGITLGDSGSGAVLEGETAPIPMHVISKEDADRERAVMIGRCAPCHTPRMARKALEDADAIKREADRLVGKAAQVVRDLADAGLIDPAPTERPAHPTAGHALVLGGQMLYEGHSNAERIFFDLAKFAHAITFKAAYHQAADHTHWLGIARLKASVVELEAEARRLRAAKSK